MEQSRSWEANIRWAIQEIHKTPPLDPIVRQMNQINTLTYLFAI